MLWVGIGRCWWLWSRYGYKFEGKCWALLASKVISREMPTNRFQWALLTHSTEEWVCVSVWTMQNDWPSWRPWMNEWMGVPAHPHGGGHGPIPSHHVKGRSSPDPTTPGQLAFIMPLTLEGPARGGSSRSPIIIVVCIVCVCTLASAAVHL